MISSVNLSPVEDLLTDAVSSERLAQIMDDIFYDYVDALFTVLLVPNHKFVLNDDVLNHLWYLRRLRNVFRACAEIVYFAVLHPFFLRRRKCIIVPFYFYDIVLISRDMFSVKSFAN